MCQNAVLCGNWSTLSQTDFSKLKDFADDNFKLDENGRMFPKRTENTVGKGEIARNQQLLLFPVFTKDL